MREAVTQVLRDYFKPEFLNRIDDIVVFKQLAREQISKIIEVQLERLRGTLDERGIRLVLDDSAKELLAEEGYDPTFGARPLKRAIQTLIQNPLAVKLLSGEISNDSILRVSADGDGKLKFTPEATATATA
jgi:ATP-dependent Clp protease ATP-binding subunit ClpB